MLPTVLLVDKIVRKIDDGEIKLTTKASEPLTLDEDGVRRFVHPMPATDSACGFYALLTGQPDFRDGVDPRQLAVQKLQAGLDNPVLQPKLCALLAPEMREALTMEELIIPKAQEITRDSQEAQANLDQAVRTANTAFGVEGKSPAEILACTDEALRVQGRNPVHREEVQRAVRVALGALNEAEAAEDAFTRNSETASAFIHQVVGSPGWMLGYGSEHYDRLHAGEGDQKPSGVMDALALVLGVNLRIYRKDASLSSFRLKLVHHKQASPDAPTVDLFHRPFEGEGRSAMETGMASLRSANHFDHLEIIPPGETPVTPSSGVPFSGAQKLPGDEGAMLFNSVDWMGKRPEIIGKFAETTYQLKQWHTEWAYHEQLIPDAALVVVALGMTIATQGIGGSLFSSAITNLTGGSMVATSTGMSMASAAFSAVCTQATTSLRHGDIIKTGQDLFSNQGLRSLGTDVATAGLIGGGGTLQGFGQRLMINGLRSVVKASVSAAIERRNLGDALKSGAIGTLVDTISGSIAEKIGNAASAPTNP